MSRKTINELKELTNLVNSALSDLEDEIIGSVEDRNIERAAEALTFKDIAQNYLEEILFTLSGKSAVC